MGFDINNLNREIFAELLQGEFGLEKETLRVDEKGNLSHTPHPFPGDPRRDRDFCENQVEMITGVHTTVEGVLEELGDIHRGTVDKIQTLPSGCEYLWPFSNPPYVKGEDDIEIAHFEGELKEKEVYREYLAEKYGKKKMLFSGIHFNFSFAERLLELDFRERAKQGTEEEIRQGNRIETEEKRTSEVTEQKGREAFQDYKNRFYLDLACKTLKYSWLIVYLTAASPLTDASFLEKDSESMGETRISEYASIRCSEEGYWNSFVPILDFSSLEGYVQSIQSYVKRGMLKMPSELYYPVRLKPRGVNSLELLSKGVNHIELRMFDLNPLAEKGIDERDLEFVYLLLTYLSLLPEERLDEEEQKRAIANMKRSALLDSDRILIETEKKQFCPVAEEALQVLDHMEELLSGIFPEEKLKECLAYQRDKVKHPANRYAGRIIREYGSDYVRNTMETLRS
ncbi:MAG: hypothetical protein Q4B26_07125 [Eubacteriales bacterium]|nr:hypothetical protein [Eubacteriales bacterium]